MNLEDFQTRLHNYLPEPSIPIIYEWLSVHRIRLKISKPRTSKLGDFRVKNGKTPASISVNGDLNPYAFLVTLTHEIAHLKDFEQRRTLKNAHGTSWKAIYGEMLHQLVALRSFPEDIVPVIRNHADRPKAASCADPILLDALRKYDDHDGTLLKELPEGSKFILPTGRRFVLGSLRRTRYKCQDLDSGRWYLIHGSAEVTVLES